MTIQPYMPPTGFRSAHLQTIYPTLFRRVPLCTNVRERIATPDGDFLDLDWVRHPPGRPLAVLTHGLEGHSRGNYIQGMAAALKRAGWDVLAWNFRGCSGEPNRKLKSYHSGATGELQTVLNHIFSETAYETVSLIGFSLGGNLTLKYIGDMGAALDPRIRSAVAISVPCDLAGSAKRLGDWQNRIYMARFMRSLRSKVYEKAMRYPDGLDLDGLDKVRTFAEFDDRYTAPIHGFRDASDYWTQCSCRFVLNRITIPTLLVNAQDDPFLTPDCYPGDAADANPNFMLETPRNGGHLGFISFNAAGEYWSERRAVAFLQTSTVLR